MHPWFVLAHVLGAFLFIGAHGVSMGATMKLRGERDRARAAVLLQLSSGSIGFMYIGLLLLLAGGIAAGFSGGFWGQWWLWTAIGVLVVVLGAMYAMGPRHYGRLRAALGVPVGGKVRPFGDDPPPTDAEIDALLDSPIPLVLGGIGGIGLAIIVWLMVVKPF